jgi:hypothetical protein
MLASRIWSEFAVKRDKCCAVTVRTAPVLKCGLSLRRPVNNRRNIPGAMNALSRVLQLGFNLAGQVDCHPDSLILRNNKSRMTRRVVHSKRN